MTRTAICYLLTFQKIGGDSSILNNIGFLVLILLLIMHFKAVNKQGRIRRQSYVFFIWIFSLWRCLLYSFALKPWTFCAYSARLWAWRASRFRLWVRWELKFKRFQVLSGLCIEAATISLAVHFHVIILRLFWMRKRMKKSQAEQMRSGKASWHRRTQQELTRAGVGSKKRYHLCKSAWARRKEPSGSSFWESNGSA